jgi:sulfoxide reductase heme-binding subunit YedZ
MKEQTETLTWSVGAMYVIGGLSGAALGVLTAIWLGNAAASQSPFYWFVSRASAIVAYLLLWLSTAWGVTISSKGIGGRVSGVLAYALHNITSWLALGFGLVHGLSLLGDKVVPFTLPGILLPFLANYRPFLTGLGTLSLYLGVIVTGAFYFKKRLGPRAWRTIHGLSYAMFVSVTFHSVMLGTDTGTPEMKAIYLVAAVSVVLLTMFRIMTARAAKGSAARGRRVEERSAA